MKLKLNDLTNQLHRNDEDRNNLQKLAQGLTDIKTSQSIKLSQLLEDNKTLKDICEEQDCCLKVNARDRGAMGKELELKNCDIKNLNCQIIKLADNQNNLQNQLNKFNCMNAQCQNTIKDYQVQSDNLKCQNENLNSNLVNEKSCRISENQKNNQLSCILDDKEKKIGMQNHDIENIKLMQQSASNKNCLLQDQNEKLRKHIMVLTDLNQTLINEIDNVIDEDAKMKCILDDLAFATRGFIWHCPSSSEYVVWRWRCVKSAIAAHIIPFLFIFGKNFSSKLINENLFLEYFWFFSFSSSLKEKFCFMIFSFLMLSNLYSLFLLLKRICISLLSFSLLISIKLSLSS